MDTSFISHVLIPGSTLLLAWGKNPFSASFSSLGAQPERRTAFLLWCLLLSLYLYVSLRPLTKQQIPAAAAFLLLVSALLPYRPATAPLLAVFHVASAFFSSLLLFFCFLQLSLTLCKKDPRKGLPVVLTLLLSALFCLSLWIRTGIISAAMEIVIILTACSVIRRLQKNTPMAELVCDKTRGTAK